MSNSEELELGSPLDAHIEKDDDSWALVLVKRFNHSPERVWKALTDPDQLRQWSPFEASRSLAETGPVTLTTVGAPDSTASPSQVTRAEPCRMLEFLWGGRLTRWELTSEDGGTHLKLWAIIDRQYIPLGATGWHLCLAVLQRLLDGSPVGRIVGSDALKVAAWKRLHREYATQFGVKENE